VKILPLLALSLEADLLVIFFLPSLQVPFLGDKGWLRLTPEKSSLFFPSFPDYSFSLLKHFPSQEPFPCRGHGVFKRPPYRLRNPMLNGAKFFSDSFPIASPFSPPIVLMITMRE